MSKLNNTNNFFETPKSIREQIKSYIWKCEPKKEYDNLSIVDFKDKIEQNYISKSNKSLKYKVFNLMGMTNKNGSYIYNINGIKNYISYLNPNAGLTSKNTVIEDINGEYLFNLDKSQSAKNFAKVKYFPLAQNTYIWNKIR